MSGLDECLDVKNKDGFKNLLREEHMMIMEREIRYFMLKGKESDFYDLDKFNRQYIKNMEETHSMVKTVQEKLKNLGWNTYLGFGDTGLYIYSTEEKPYGAY